jgi:hypothetical protein
LVVRLQPCGRMKPDRLAGTRHKRAVSIPACADATADPGLRLPPSPCGRRCRLRRRLMNQGKLVRTGQGGRGNPFCYRCTPLGIETLQRIEDAATPDDDPSGVPNAEQRAAAVAVARPPEEV